MKANLIQKGLLMISQFRSNLILLGLSILLCCIAYPATLLLLGQVLFKHQAEGSLLPRQDGKVVGSRQIAQEFTKPQYFQSRPSSGGYKADASGGSNLAASNPQLRDRVARDLAAIYFERDDKLAAEVEAWARKMTPHTLSYWVKKNPTLAENWLADNKDAVGAWLKQNQAEGQNFYAVFAAKHFAAWPKIEEEKKGEETIKRVVASTDGAEIQAAFFDLWLQAHPDRASDLKQPVVADRLMTSGSGLDPHITRRNADSQVDRVVKEWVKLRPKAAASVEGIVKKALEQHSGTHLFGSEPLVNSPPI
jgi:potassium-transporting ATPase KdpC subunit